MSCGGSDYSERVLQQIAQYEGGIDIHSLPAIHDYWRQLGIQPVLEHVFGVTRAREAIVEGLAAAAAHARGSARFLSLGCGDGTQEIAIAQALLERSVDFEIVCTELSASLLGRFRAAIPQRLTRHFCLIEQDINEISVEGLFDGVFANHSLHHVVELEDLFSFVFERMKDHGIFAVNDMIGRNGHMRWPEVLVHVESFWRLLSEKHKKNVMLRRIEHDFVNHDCSTEGFEGVRAQDILPLMLKQFHPHRFAGFGGVIDPFVDRAFGHNFNISDERDLALIDCISTVNEALLDADAIKPTMMVAYFGKQPVEERYYRARTARRSVRLPVGVT